MSGDMVPYHVDDKWDVQVDTMLFTGFRERRNRPEPWTGEVAIWPNVRLDQMHRVGDLEDLFAHSAAAWCNALGWLVGERPRVDMDSRTERSGRVRARVTCLVTVPPYWEPPAIPGQQSLWGAA
jgi:hypothetical protein